LSWPDVTYATVISYLYISNKKGISFFATYTTTITTLHVVKQQSTTNVRHFMP